MFHPQAAAADSVRLLVAVFLVSSPQRELIDEIEGDSAV